MLTQGWGRGCVHGGSWGQPALTNSQLWSVEQQVAQDTEEVFRSYVFYLHQQEQETQGAAAPANPEMDNLPLEPNR